MATPNVFKLTKDFYALAYSEAHKIKPIDHALYFWIVERANRSGWKKVIDIQSELSMETLGVTDWRTYSKSLLRLEEFKLIKWVFRNKNQYTCNRVELVFASTKNAEANVEANVKASAEAHVEANAEALQSYLNLKTNKLENLKTKEKEIKSLEIKNSKLEAKNKKLERENLKLREVIKASDIPTEIELPFTSQKFIKAWKDWNVFRVAQGKKYKTIGSQQAALTELKKMGLNQESKCISILTHTMGNGWQGFRVPENGSKVSETGALKISAQPN